MTSNVQTRRTAHITSLSFIAAAAAAVLHFIFWRIVGEAVAGRRWWPGDIESL